MEAVPQGLDTIRTSRKGVTHIPNGATTTYNDNIHQNIFRSYKYINNEDNIYPIHDISHDVDEQTVDMNKHVATSPN